MCVNAFRKIQSVMLLGLYSCKDIHEFREIFNLVDTDGSGAISSEELGVLVESVGKFSAYYLSISIKINVG